MVIHPAYRGIVITSFDPDADQLADDLIRGDVSGWRDWFAANVPGMQVSRWPDQDAPTYSRIDATRAYWEGLPMIDGVANTLTVDPLQLRPALGSLMLLDVIDGGRDFHYSLFGSRIAQLSGFDMTGKRLSELPSRTVAQSFFRACYLGVTRHRLPLFTIHDAADNVMIGRWHRLHLPMGRDGEVRRILVCSVGARPDGEEK